MNLCDVAYNVYLWEQRDGFSAKLELAQCTTDSLDVTVFLYHATFVFYFFRVVKSMEVVEGKAKNGLSDDMLDNVSGGFTDRDRGFFWQMRYKFYETAS